MHCIATVTNIIIPLVFDLTTANVYDNQLSDLLYEAKIYNPFLILAATYDSAEWFEIASDLKFNLLTDINMRKAKALNHLQSKDRKCFIHAVSYWIKNRAIILCVKRIIQFREPKTLWASPIRMSYKIGVISMFNR